MENQPRPGMRRKSSASNLLATFQGSRSNSIQNISSAVTQTPKEWDSTPPFSDLASSAAVSNISSPPAISSYESIRETLNRRLLALAHLRQGHEGYAAQLASFVAANAW